MAYVCLATEDELSEEVCSRLIRDIGNGLNIGQTIRRNGFGYLRHRIAAFLEIANHQPVFLLTDLDTARCPSALINDWIGNRPVPTQLIFRIAVREVEAWLLADHMGLRNFLGSRVTRLPSEPDRIADPKQTLLQIASRAPRDLRNDLLPRSGSFASQGIGYNRRLVEFVRTMWNPTQAANRSPSLQRACNRLTALANSQNVQPQVRS